MGCAETEFERELEAFRNETNAAIQFFYIWQTVHAVSASEKSVHRALNRTPLFWNTTLGALQTASLVVLGRVFDPDQQNHNVSRLLAIAHKNLEIFSLDALGRRKRSGNPSADEWLPAYLESAYVPTSADFRRLKRHVEIRRRIYVEKYRPLRHKVFAHKAIADHAEIAALFARTNTRELQQMLVFLSRLYEALWQLFVNGRKPTLRPARYSVRSMREQPSHQHQRDQLQERLIHETERLLKSIG